jgi:hypothetical protein
LYCENKKSQNANVDKPVDKWKKYLKNKSEDKNKKLCCIVKNGIKQKIYGEIKNFEAPPP